MTLKVFIKIFFVYLFLRKFWPLSRWRSYGNDYSPCYQSSVQISLQPQKNKRSEYFGMVYSARKSLWITYQPTGKCDSHHDIVNETIAEFGRGSICWFMETLLETWNKADLKKIKRWFFNLQKNNMDWVFWCRFSHGFFVDFKIASKTKKMKLFIVELYVENSAF